MDRRGIRMNTGEWIRAERTNLGYSRERLAEAIDCSVRAVKDWEANVREPSARFMAPLISLLGTPSALESKRVMAGIPGTDRGLIKRAAASMRFPSQEARVLCLTS